MHIAGEVDEAVRTLDQPGQEVGRQGVDRECSRMPLRSGIGVGVGVDGRVVDDGIHPAEAVDLIGETARLFRAGEVADDDGCSEVDEISEDRRSFWIACVDDHLVAAVDQVPGG
jgi:hypothetical protein